jgi:hypothetical protein
MQQATYPVQFSVDYPDRQLDRVSTLFRVFTAIPIVILLGFISGQAWQWTWSSQASETATTTTAAAGGVLFGGTLLMILFRRKYPRWWFDWHVEFIRFSNRVAVYLALMNDQYPATDDHQTVHLDYVYPNVEHDLNRWLPLVKWLLAIPHYIVLIFLNLAALLAIIVSWFAILITGRYPRGLFDLVEGVLRWNNRVTGYAVTLVTDQYPPFRLSA